MVCGVMGSLTRIVNKLRLGLGAKPQMKFAQAEMRLSVCVSVCLFVFLLQKGRLTDSVVTEADTIAVRVRRSAV